VTGFSEADVGDGEECAGGGFGGGRRNYGVAVSRGYEHGVFVAAGGPCARIISEAGEVR
jgi:hypothetical protein